MIKEISEDDWDLVVTEDLKESLKWAENSQREDDYIYLYIADLSDYIQMREEEEKNESA